MVWVIQGQPPEKQVKNLFNNIELNTHVYIFFF